MNMNNQVNIGDRVTPIRDIEFMDGSLHKAGHFYLVMENTLSYFRINHKDYMIVKAN